MDEMTTTGATRVAELRGGMVKTFEVTPADAGLLPARLSDLMGGDAETNAAAIRDVLADKKGPFRDIVLLNTAAALVVAGKADSLGAGVDLAAGAIQSGAAQGALDKLIEITHAST
ncbi:MAG: anthranilate phosphoribosyltransferase, partial [Pseudomonadota bacterium]